MLQMDTVNDVYLKPSGFGYLNKVCIESFLKSFAHTGFMILYSLKGGLCNS